MTCTEIAFFEHKQRVRQRKDKNWPFGWKFDVFEFGILHSDGDNVFATTILHDEDMITDGAQHRSSC